MTPPRVLAAIGAALIVIIVISTLTLIVAVPIWWLTH